MNRLLCVVMAAGTLCALCVASWFHLDRGLSPRDALERSPFPLVVHEIWLGDEMPAVKRMLVNRNEEILSPWGWQLRLWGIGDVTKDNFPNTYATIKRGLEHHARTGQNTFSMVGDLMKFEILYTHGGLYLDTNVELLRDPSPLFWDTANIGREAFFIADPGDNRFISAGMIGALAPGSKLLGRVVENPAYLEGVDFGHHCIANALTGPVMLTMHLEHDKSLLETVSVFDRDVAYPIACGENYLDPCIHELSKGEEGSATAAAAAREVAGTGENGGLAASAMDADPDIMATLEGKTGTASGTGTVTYAAATAVARSMGSVGTAGAALGDGSYSEARRSVDRRRVHPHALDPESGAGDGDAAAIVARVHGGIKSTVRGIAAAVREPRRMIEGERGERWNRHSIHSVVPSKLVTEEDGSVWNVTVPCRAIARRYPDSYALDHFSVGGASWQRDCDMRRKAEDMVTWVEDHVPPDVDLVHKWAMSAVRYLGGPERSGELIKRVRLHQTGGKPGKARMLILASSLRSGGALLNEILETTADHPVDSKIWFREDGPRADAFFVTYITLGDLWSHGAFKNVKPNTWQAKLRNYLRASGVSGRAIAEAHVKPAEFMEEVLEKLWEVGIDLVHVLLTQTKPREAAAPVAKVEEDRASERRHGDEMEGVGTRGGAGGVEGSDGDNATVAHGEPLNNTALLDALLERFPDSPTICLKRRNMLDAYVSLYRAEHGDAPWQLVAEPPPSPVAPQPGVDAMGGTGVKDVNGERMTGVWELAEMDGTMTGRGRGGEGGEETSRRNQRGRQASSEAFGAFGPLPPVSTSATKAAALNGSATATRVDSNTWVPHQVRFDPLVFKWLERFETSWLAHVAARTRELGKECEELVYEDNLVDEGRQAQTLKWLKERFDLNINVDALPLQKMRRISTVPVTLRDFVNPDDLDEHARSFLHQIPDEGAGKLRDGVIEGG